MRYDYKTLIDKRMWMDMAWLLSKRSHSKKRKVGAVLVKEGDPISVGWNGMPSGMDNCCEIWDESRSKYITRPEVLHAEENIVRKMARKTLSSIGSSLYITYAPCEMCARLIWGMGIKEVFYEVEDTDPIQPGVVLLKNLGIEVIQLPPVFTRNIQL